MRLVISPIIKTSQIVSRWKGKKWKEASNQTRYEERRIPKTLENKYPWSKKLPKNFLVNGRKIIPRLKMASHQRKMLLRSKAILPILNGGPAYFN